MNVDLPGLSELGAEVKKPKIDLNKEEDFGKAKLIAPRPKRNGPLFYLFAFYLYYVLYCFINEAIFNVSFPLVASVADAVLLGMWIKLCFHWQSCSVIT